MHDYRRILALVDFDDTGLRVARRAIDLARPGGAELALLHWVRPDSGVDGGYPPPSPAEEKQAFEAAALRRLKFLAGHPGLAQDGREPTLLAVYGHGPHAWLDRIADWRPDLVVAGRHPGHLGERHDLLTLGDPHRRGGRLIRILKSFMPHPEGWLAHRA